MWLPPELLWIAKGQRRLKLDERQVLVFYLESPACMTLSECLLACEI